MSCELYWQKGIDLFERGEADPHRESCEECQREHLVRTDMVGLFPLIDAGVTGDPNWQANVWRRIARDRARKPRGLWFFASAFVTTVVLVLLWWLPADENGLMPISRVEIQRHGSATRGAAKDNAFTLGDDIYMHVNPGEEVRLYMEGRLVRQCSTDRRATNCIKDRIGVSLEANLTWPYRYQLMTIQRGGNGEIPPTTNSFEGDRQALRAANIFEQHMELRIR